MAYVELNNLASPGSGIGVNRAKIGIPRIGLWHADLVLEDATPSDIQGQVQISLGPGRLILNGFVRRARVGYGIIVARITAGAGNFPLIATPANYYNATAQSILQALLTSVGEVLNTSISDQQTLQRVVPFWSIEGRPGGAEMVALCAYLGVAWRVMPDGTTFVGPETWGASPLTDYSILYYAPQELRCMLSTEDPVLWPGTVFEGGQVSYIEHEFYPDKLETEVWFEDQSLPT